MTISGKRIFSFVCIVAVLADAIMILMATMGLVPISNLYIFIMMMGSTSILYLVLNKNKK